MQKIDMPATKWASGVADLAKNRELATKQAPGVADTRKNEQWATKCIGFCGRVAFF